MKNRKIIISVILVIAIIVAIVAVLWNSKGEDSVGNTVAFAEYSSPYYKTFGDFSASTASMLLNDKKENTCYSPLSLFAAMSLTAEITEGETQKEILGCMHVDSLEALEESYWEMLSDIAVETSKYKITLANSFWTVDNENREKLESVIDRMEHKLDCEVFLEDKIMSDEVNGWVKDKTNGLIDSLIKEDDYWFLLANTLYYKSRWEYEMSEMPEKQKFYTEYSEEVEVEFLQAKLKEFEYKISEDYIYVEVPMAKGEFLLVLPNDGKSLKDILNKDTLNDIIATSTSYGIKQKGYVNIKFPQLDIDGDVVTEEFQAVLRESGINKLWDSPDWVEGLSGMPVDILQKTKLVVNKDGVEAAAATALGPAMSAKLDEPDVDLEITYDSPFLYVIMNEGVPLFIGTVYNPAE